MTGSAATWGSQIKMIAGLLVLASLSLTHPVYAEDKEVVTQSAI